MRTFVAHQEKRRRLHLQQAEDRLQRCHDLESEAEQVGADELPCRQGPFVVEETGLSLD